MIGDNEVSECMVSHPLDNADCSILGKANISASAQHFQRHPSVPTLRIRTTHNVARDK